MTSEPNPSPGQSSGEPAPAEPPDECSPQRPLTGRQTLSRRAHSPCTFLDRTGLHSVLKVGPSRAETPADLALRPEQRQCKKLHSLPDFAGRSAASSSPRRVVGSPPRRGLQTSPSLPTVAAWRRKICAAGSACRWKQVCFSGAPRWPVLRMGLESAATRRAAQARCGWWQQRAKSGPRLGHLQFTSARGLGFAPAFDPAAAAPTLPRVRGLAYMSPYRFALMSPAELSRHVALRCLARTGMLAPIS